MHLEKVELASLETACDIFVLFRTTNFRKLNKTMHLFFMEHTMDKRFPEQPDGPGWHEQPPQSRPKWTGFYEQPHEPEITLFPRYQERQPFPEHSPERWRGGLAPVYIVILILCVLIAASAGSLVTVLVLRHSSATTRNSISITAGAPTTSAQGTQPAPSTHVAPTIPPGSLYTVQAGGITRIDLQKSTSIWSMVISGGSPSSPLVVGNKLFFANEQSPGFFLEAARVDNGQQIWRNATYAGDILMAAGNMLYDSSCITNASGTSVQCYLYGLNADTGAQAWSYKLSQGDAWMAMQNGVIYGVSYTDYFALNATTGVPLWQKNLFLYPDQESNLAPAVSGNVLSSVACNETKQSRGAPGCYLYAFDTRTGAELWHMYTTAHLMATPAILDGVVYAGAVDGTVYAVNEQNGKKLWTANAGAPVGQLLAGGGIVYVETVDSNGQPWIVAYDTTSHKNRWSQNSTGSIFKTPGQPALFSTTTHKVPYHPLSALSGGMIGSPFILNHGLVYLYSNGAVNALNASDGSTVTQYNVGSIFGFTVVTQ